MLSIACTRGHVTVIDYFVKGNGWDLDGEITVICTIILLDAADSRSYAILGPVNSAGDTLKSLAESHRLSEVVKYLDNLIAGSAGECCVLH